MDVRSVERGRVLLQYQYMQYNTLHEQPRPQRLAQGSVPWGLPSLSAGAFVYEVEKHYVSSGLSGFRCEVTRKTLDPLNSVSFRRK